MRFGVRESLFVLLLVGVLVAAYFVVVKGPNEQTAKMREDMRRDQAKLAALEKTSALIHNLDDEIARLGEAVEAFEQKLPAQREVEGVLKEVTELAAANNLTVKSVRTDKIEKETQYATLPMKMQITGDFDGFYNFLQAVERLQRITRMPTMNLKKETREDEAEGAMTAEITLNIYFEGDAANDRAAARS